MSAGLGGFVGVRARHYVLRRGQHDQDPLYHCRCPLLPSLQPRLLTFCAHLSRQCLKDCGTARRLPSPNFRAALDHNPRSTSLNSQTMLQSSADEPASSTDLGLLTRQTQLQDCQNPPSRCQWVLQGLRRIRHRLSPTQGFTTHRGAYP